MFRRYPMPSLWDEVERLQQEMNRLFSESFPGRLSAVSGFPAINLWSHEDGAVLTAELPGLKVEDLELKTVNDTLTISGSRTSEPPAEGVEVHRQERSFGRFTRTIQLPFVVEAEKVNARYRDGLLTITLPRAESERPRRIAIQAS